MFFCLYFCNACLELGGTYSTHGETNTTLKSEYMNGRGHLGDVGLGMKIILKLIEKICMDSSG